MSENKKLKEIISKDWVENIIHEHNFGTNEGKERERKLLIEEILKHYLPISEVEGNCPKNPRDHRFIHAAGKESCVHCGKERR